MNRVLAAAGLAVALIAQAQSIPFDVQAHHTCATGAMPWHVAAGDFNRDGAPELAILTSTETSTVSILLGNRDRTFQPPIVYTLGGVFLDWLAVADFNGDGIPDMAMALGYLDGGSALDPAVVNYALDSTEGSLSILRGNGDGTFRPAVGEPGGPRSIAVEIWERVTASHD
jgi:hypothetical protein